MRWALHNIRIAQLRKVSKINEILIEFQFKNSKQTNVASELEQMKNEIEIVS